MTTDEAKAAKAQLESLINTALCRFSADTGAVVARVEVYPVMVLGAPATYRVDVEARL